tara:strand:- start:1556 stop:1738 length:183 start_codon:yes stop_codon:yes gene_type:complete
MKKACKKCKLIVDGPTCPICKGNQFSESWKGRVYISNPEKSEIAKNMELNAKGEYAIKTK